MTDVTDVATGVMGSIPNTQPVPPMETPPGIAPVHPLANTPLPSPKANVAQDNPSLPQRLVTTNPTPVITIDSTAARGIALSLATGALRVIGTAMVAHGVMTQGQVDSTIPIAAQDIVGTGVLLIGQFWAWLREQSAHNRTMAAAMALPSQIVVKGQ
jgi:hypothetical protein